MNALEALTRCLSSTATEFGSSRWAEFRACPYGHHLRFVEGVSPRPEATRDDQGRLDYFQVGQAVHGARAYSALGVIHGFAADWKAFLDRAARQGVWGAPEVEEARRLLWPYFASYGAQNAGWGSDFKLVDVEPDGWEVNLAKWKFKPPPPDDAVRYKYTTRPDAVLKRKKLTVAPRGNAGYAYRARRFVLGEIKTRSRNYSESDEELAIAFKTRPQFLGHCYVGREILGEIPDLLVDLIIKTKIPAFRRITVRFADSELDEWALNHVASLENRSFTERWKNYASCYPEMGSPCWATRWCHGVASERKSLFQITRKPSYEPKERENAQSDESERGKKRQKARRDAARAPH